MRRISTKFMIGCMIPTLAIGLANAQISNQTVKIGFITDMSSAYADTDGKAGIEAIRMAIADSTDKLKNAKVELLYADHQNKADIAASKAREWFDQEGLDILIGGTNSAASLAMAQVATEKKKPFIAVGGGTTALTNEACSFYTIQYAYDTAAVARTTANAVVALGGKTWFFITADYAYGASLQKEVSDVVVAHGGSVVGSIKHPLSTLDFSSPLIQAQTSKAQVLGLANAGSDLIASIKGAREFGLTKTMVLATPLMFETDINALGLDATQGMYTSSSWYWDTNDATRTWSKRFIAVTKRPPTFLHAAEYSATKFYLDAVAATGTDDSDKIMTKMRSSRVNDIFATDAYIRPDGRLNKDMFLLRVKAPEESKYPWDFFKIIKTIPGDQALIQKSESKCRLWK